MKTFAHSLVQRCNTGRLRTTTARLLSAYNVGDSVATTTTACFSAVVALCVQRMHSLLAVVKFLVVFGEITAAVVDNYRIQG